MIFRFKRFEVVQAKSAMKIGTDAVLLGAWAPFSLNHRRILDIGTGTGVLALMMAQRFPEAQINAIDIDENAIEESYYNFEQSPWANRLSVEWSSLNAFCQNDPPAFDAIVCNPPFYKDGFSPNKTPRSKARDSKHLLYADLFSAANQCLTPKGEFALVAPFSEKENLLRLGKENKLFPRQILAVKARPHLSFKRIYMLFGRNVSDPIEEESLTLEKEQHLRTPSYQKIVAPFYL